MPFTQDNKKVIDIKNTDTSTQGTWKVITSNDVSHSVKDGTETHATPPSSESLSTARRKHQSARCRNRYAARARTH